MIMNMDHCWGVVDNQINADNLVLWVETRSEKDAEGRSMKHD